MGSKKKKPVSGKRPGAVPKGYHRMPDGSLMKGSAHKATPRKRISQTRKNNMDY